MPSMNDSTPLRLAVIVGSTREGRFADTIARWFVEEAARDDLVIDVLDLVDLDLPAHLPATRPPSVDAFAGRVAAADGFVVITPEYNHGYPAPLKQAIDLLRREWQAKPVGFVSYGGMSGGLRAVEQLRQVFAEVHAVTVRDTVSFHGAWQCFADGRPVDAVGPAAAVKTMLDEWAWWAEALRTARHAHPYAA